MLAIKELVGGAEGANALSGITLTANDKGIFGVLCARREQRSALARLICGCENAQSGEVIINGKHMSRRAYALKRKVRLVPSALVTDTSCTAAEYLNFVGDALGVELEKRYRQIKEALEITGLEASQNKLIAALGASELCRLAFAGALIGNPEIIVLDNPFSAVDGETKNELYALLDVLAGIKTVILLSESVAEVKSLCTHVAVISKGRVALEGEIAEIERKINVTRELFISVRGEEDAVLGAVRSLECVADAKIISTEQNGVHSVRVEYYPDDSIKDKLFAVLSQINAPMLSIRTVTLTLEDVYFSLTDGERDKDGEAAEEPKKQKKQRFGNMSRRKKQ